MLAADHLVKRPRPQQAVLQLLLSGGQVTNPPLRGSPKPSVLPRQRLARRALPRVPPGRSRTPCVIICLITGSHRVLSVLPSGSLQPAGSQLPLVLNTPHRCPAQSWGPPATRPSSVPVLLPSPRALWAMGHLPGLAAGRWVSLVVETDPGRASAVCGQRLRVCREETHIVYLTGLVV